MSHKHSCLESIGRKGLGCICGSTIDTDDIPFTRPKSNLVYLDKVFSFQEAVSCPLLLNLNTSGSMADHFDVSLSLENQDCCCSSCTAGPGAVFTVERSRVIVETFTTRPPGNIDPCQVTVNGFPVDSVNFSGGQYTAGTSNLLPFVEKQVCMDNGLATKTFMLINAAGPWSFRARYVLEGRVNTNGTTCRFRAVISNKPCAPGTALPNDNVSNFAIPDVSLPCSKTNIAPDILFQFDAAIKLINPQLCIDCCGCGSEQECTLSMNACLVIEPQVHVEVVRRTLFCIEGCEALIPCDDDIRAAEEEEERCPDPFGPDCKCGSGLGRPDSGCNQGCDSNRPDCDCNQGCGSNRPDCDCNQGCGSNRPDSGCNQGCGSVRPDWDCDCSQDCGSNRPDSGCNQGCGSVRPDCDCDCGPVRPGWDCDCNQGCGSSKPDCNDHCHNPGIQPRTAFQFSGSNGCSW